MTLRRDFDDVWNLLEYDKGVGFYKKEENVFTGRKLAGQVYSGG